MARLLDVFGQYLQPDKFSLAVSLGQIPGWRNFAEWHETPEVSSTQEEMSNIASGIRVLPTSGGEITVASSSASDTAAGTGARTLRILYLDSEFEEQTYDLTLNGTTDVVSSGLDAYRFTTAKVLTAGSTGAAVGNITISMGGNPQTRILATQNESRESGFTVPADTRFISAEIILASGRAGAVDVDFAFEYREPTDSVWYTLRSLQTYQAVGRFPEIDTRVFPTGTDLRVLAAATGGTGPSAYVQWKGYFVAT